MNVAISDEQDDPLEPESLRALAQRVIDAERLPSHTVVSITLVDQARMAALNDAHMGKPGPTDVLAFPLEDLVPGRALPDFPEGAPPFAIGDVFICPPVVKANAVAAEVPFEDELALMVVHGILHLLGYDHVADDEAELMEGRERALLAAAGRSRP